MAKNKISNGSSINPDNVNNSHDDEAGKEAEVKSGDEMKTIFEDEEEDYEIVTVCEDEIEEESAKKTTGEFMLQKNRKRGKKRKRDANEDNTRLGQYSLEKKRDSSPEKDESQSSHLSWLPPGEVEDLEDAPTRMEVEEECVNVEVFTCTACKSFESFDFEDVAEHMKDCKSKTRDTNSPDKVIEPAPNITVRISPKDEKPVSTTTIFVTTSPTNPDVSAEHKSLSASPTPDDSKATSIAEVKDEIVSSDEPAELTIKVESSSSSPVKTESQSYLKINQAVQSSSNSNWSEPEGVNPSHSFPKNGLEEANEQDALPAAEKETHICSECDFVCDSTRVFMCHYELRHTELESFACDLCTSETGDQGVSFLTQVTRNRHWESAHYQCSKCDYRANSQKMFLVHVTKAHPKIYHCIHCEVQTKTQNQMDLHVESTHLSTSQKPEPSPGSSGPTPFDPIVSCRECNYKTSKLFDLHAHMKQIHKYTKLSCTHDDCVFATDQLWKMMSHEKSHSSVRGYKCNQCNYTTDRHMFLTRHIKNVHGEKLFSCSVCSFRSAQRWCVTQHIKHVHLKTVWFECPYQDCLYKATAKGNLNVHIRGVHLRDKKINCGKCSFQTALKSSLINHYMSAHGIKVSDEIQFCPDCDFRTDLLAKLADHRREMHSGQLHCGFCTHKANNQESLERHMRIIHDPTYEEEHG